MDSDIVTAVHWFRKGLRVHDNPALFNICQIARNSENHEPNKKYCVRPIFILDPEIKNWIKVGANRWRFLQQSLKQLDENLREINSRLYVVRGNPLNLFPQLFRRWNITVLSFETDIEPYARIRDAEITRLAGNNSVKVISESSHTIFNPELVLQRNLGKPPMQYQKFLSLIEKLKIPTPRDRPDALSDDMIPKADECELADYNCYNVPTLEELVSDPENLGPLKFPGGETEALRRMSSSLMNDKWVCTFEKPNTSPNSLEPSTTVLSPYLKFGCLSARLLHKNLTEILKKHPNHSQPPVSLLGQLIWREFYYTAAAAEPNFHKMLGNSICYQIPWQTNDSHLNAWTHGRTGYPFIDAIMRQLRQEGWIHHLARHAVACFLTRGDLWISWEEGQNVFEELLLDADWALNAGNWMWLSASAFFYEYFRVYSPIAFGKKTDPQGTYIKKYVPELAMYPSEFIYEPWKTVLGDQRKYKCVLGKDYPHRIVIHETVHKVNIQKMAAAYKVNQGVCTDKPVCIETIGKRFKMPLFGNQAKRRKHK